MVVGKVGEDSAMVREKRTIFFLFILSQHAGAIPVVNPKSGCPNFDFNDVAGPELCFLTPKLGGQGTRTFLEECTGLGERERIYVLKISH